MELYNPWISGPLRVSRVETDGEREKKRKRGTEGERKKDRKMLQGVRCSLLVTKKQSKERKIREEDCTLSLYHSFRNHYIFNSKTIPDPPILAFLEKARAFPQKSKGFSLRGTPKILGKERQNAQKSKENRKTKKARKSKKQGLEGQGLNHVTVIAGNSWEALRRTISCNSILQQGNCNCNPN